MPQIIMMCHAAHINHKRMDSRIDKNRERPEGFVKNIHTTANPYTHINPTTKAKEFEDPVVIGPDGTQKLSEMSTDFEKLAKYLNFNV